MPDSHLTVNGSVGHTYQYQYFNRNPRLAPLAVAVLGVFVLAALVAAKDEPQVATISELFRDSKSPHGMIFWFALVLGGGLLLASGRLEWIQPSVPIFLHRERFR